MTSIVGAGKSGSAKAPTGMEMTPGRRSISYQTVTQQAGQKWWRAQ
jgi:hypothetical protein